MMIVFSLLLLIFCSGFDPVDGIEESKGAKGPVDPWLYGTALGSIFAVCSVFAVINCCLCWGKKKDEETEHLTRSTQTEHLTERVVIHEHVVVNHGNNYGGGDQWQHGNNYGGGEWQHGSNYGDGGAGYGHRETVEENRSGNHFRSSLFLDLWGASRG